MSGELRVFVADENEPDLAIFELVAPSVPRAGDVVGDFLTGTFRVERRVFVLEAEKDGKRTAKAIHLVCKRVIV